MVAEKGRVAFPHTHTHPNVTWRIAHLVQSTPLNEQGPQFSQRQRLQRLWRWQQQLGCMVGLVLDDHQLFPSQPMRKGHLLRLLVLYNISVWADYVWWRWWGVQLAISANIGICSASRDLKGYAPFIGLFCF